MHSYIYKVDGKPVDVQTYKKHQNKLRREQKNAGSAEVSIGDTKLTLNSFMIDSIREAHRSFNEMVGTEIHLDDFVRIGLMSWTGKFFRDAR